MNLYVLNYILTFCLLLSMISLLSTACLLDMSPLLFMCCPCMNVLLLGTVCISSIFVWWLSAYFPYHIYRLTQSVQNYLVTATLLLKWVFYLVDCQSTSYTAYYIYFSSLYHGLSLLLPVRIMDPYIVFILYYCDVWYSSIFAFPSILILGFSHMICECSLWCNSMLCFFVILWSWIVCLMVIYSFP